MNKILKKIIAFVVCFAIMAPSLAYASQLDETAIPKIQLLEELEAEQGEHSDWEKIAPDEETTEPDDQAVEEQNNQDSDNQPVIDQDENNQNSDNQPSIDQDENNQDSDGQPVTDQGENNQDSGNQTSIDQDENNQDSDNQPSIDQDENNQDSNQPSIDQEQDSQNSVDEPENGQEPGDNLDNSELEPDHTAGNEPEEEPNNTPDTPPHDIENKPEALPIEEENPEYGIMPALTPISEIYAFEIEGHVTNDKNTKKVVEKLQCGQGYGPYSSITAATKTKFDRNKVTIKVRYIGYHYTWFDTVLSDDAYYSTSAPYDNIMRPDGSSAGFTKDYYVFTSDPDAKQSTITLTGIADSSISNEKFNRTIVINWNDGDKAQGPTTPEIVFDLSTPDKYVLKGINSSMEYRKGNETEWTSCSNGPILFDIPTADILIHVRYKAEGSTEASQSKQLTIPARKSAPTVAYDIKTEILTVTKDMEYSINGGRYTDVTDEMAESGNISSIIDAIPFGSTAALDIRYKATNTVPCSNVTSKVLYARAAAPTDLTFDYAAYKAITTSTTLQYKIVGKTDWANLSKDYSFDGKLYSDQDTTILFRERAVKNQCSASMPVTIIVPKEVEGCKTVVLDTFNETLTGFKDGTNYQWRTSSTWYDLTVSKGSFSISNRISSSKPVEFYIREKASATTPPSAEKLIILPARRPKPANISIVFNDPAHYDLPYVKGLTSTQEYAVTTNKTWINCTSNLVLETPAANTSFYVREKATKDNFASSQASFTLYGRGYAPSCSYSTTTELLTGISEKLEYSLGSAYIDGTGEAIDLSAFVDKLTQSVQIKVRSKVTETKPSSKEKVITIYPRAAKPTGVSYDAAAKTLTGTANTMQYKIGEAGAWKSISGKTVNLSSHVSATENVTVYVRTKPTSKLSASKPITFIIPKG